MGRGAPERHVLPEDQFGALMAPALLVELNMRTRWQPGGLSRSLGLQRTHGHPAGATAAGVVAVPRPARVLLADPAAVLTLLARRHANNSAPALVNFTNVPDSCRGSRPPL
jgi:hypothetical protein